MQNYVLRNIAIRILSACSRAHDPTMGSGVETVMFTKNGKFRCAVIPELQVRLTQM